MCHCVCGNWLQGSLDWLKPRKQLSRYIPTTEFVRANRLTEIIFLLLEERLKLCLMLPLFHSIADTQTYNSKLIIQFNSFSECSGASSGTSHKHVSSQIQASLPPTVFSESLELGDVCGEVFRMTESVSYLVHKPVQQCYFYYVCRFFLIKVMVSPVAPAYRRVRLPFVWYPLSYWEFVTPHKTLSWTTAIYFWKHVVKLV